MRWRADNINIGIIVYEVITVKIETGGLGLSSKNVCATYYDPSLLKC